MYKRHELGKFGENMACDFLQSKMIKILVRNFRCKFGEVDIIAKDNEEIVFVEVKTRSQKKYGNPADAVDRKKEKHIYNVAMYYMVKNNIENKPCRLDVIEIYYTENGAIINYIKNSILDKPFTR